MDRFQPPDERDLVYIDICSCGCKTAIEIDDSYIRFEDEYFVDEYCLMKWLQENFNMEFVD